MRWLCICLWERFKCRMSAAEQLVLIGGGKERAIVIHCADSLRLRRFNFFCKQLQLPKMDQLKNIYVCEKGRQGQERLPMNVTAKRRYRWAPSASHVSGCCLALPVSTPRSYYEIVIRLNFACPELEKQEVSSKSSEKVGWGVHKHLSCFSATICLQIASTFDTLKTFIRI